MKRKKAEGAKTRIAPLVRASISFPPDLYESLEDIAKEKKVSLAWVVRDAAEKYVVNETGRGDEEEERTAPGTGKLTRRST
jgi:metal-responsive CopG/Arc/MetJ family transcriptional regulator